MESTIPAVMSADIPHPNRVLLSLTRNGDQSAREELGRHVGSAAYVFALQLTGNPEAARDVAQHSALMFFKHLDRFDAERPVEPWLYQIVRNRVRDLMRRERLRRHESLDAWLERGRPEPVDPSADPAGVAERHDLQQRLWQSVSRLSEAHREILVLRDYHDLSYREIAEVLSIPQGTVMSRLHGARRSLSEIIRAQGDSFPDQPPNRRGDR